MNKFEEALWKLFLTSIKALTIKEEDNLQEIK